MKTFLIIVALVAAGYFAYQKFTKIAGPLVIKDPVYAEMRASTVIQGREIEMAVFVRSLNKAECTYGTRGMSGRGAQGMSGMHVAGTEMPRRTATALREAVRRCSHSVDVPERNQWWYRRARRPHRRLRPDRRGGPGRVRDAA